MSAPPSTSPRVPVASGLKPYYEDAESGIVIYHGDCRDVLPALPVVDHVVTDPPYADETHDGARTQNAADKLIDFSSIGIDELRSVLGLATVRRWMVATMDWRHVARLESSPPNGFRFVRFGIWIKPNGAPQFTGDRPATGWEAVGIFHASDAKLKWNGGGRHGVWTFSKQNTLHPTGKPMTLTSEFVRLFTDAGENEGENDERDCIPDFIEAVRKKRPRMFLMENVRGLLKDRHWAYFQRAIACLESCGYVVKWKLLDAVNFGAPQFRERVWVWGIRSNLHRDGLRHAWPMPTHAWPAPVGATLFGEPLLPGVTVGEALDIHGLVQSHADPATTTDRPSSTLRAGGAGHDGCCLRLQVDPATLVIHRMRGNPTMNSKPKKTARQKPAVKARKPLTWGQWGVIAEPGSRLLATRRTRTEAREIAERLTAQKIMLNTRYRPVRVTITEDIQS